MKDPVAVTIVQEDYQEHIFEDHFHRLEKFEFFVSEQTLVDNNESQSLTKKIDELIDLAEITHKATLSIENDDCLINVQHDFANHIQNHAELASYQITQFEKQ